MILPPTIPNCFDPADPLLARLVAAEVFGGLDADAAAHIAATGATDVVALDAWVRGLKALGIWNDIVCWPMRAAQNHGTGTVLRSLGGLGAFNGTLVNGPTWGADGIFMNATTKAVALPSSADSFLANLRSSFVVFVSGDDRLNQHLVEITGNDLTTRVFLMHRFDGQNFGGVIQGIKVAASRNSALSSNINGSRPINLNAWRTTAATIDLTTDNVYENGSLASGGARTGLPDLNPVGPITIRNLISNSLNMTGAMVMLSPVKWTGGQVADINALYESTLGGGLGLP